MTKLEKLTLCVDISTGKAETEPLPEEINREFVGGFGVNNYLAYRLLPADIEPLSPENIIILGAGVLGGTSAPASSKIMATTRFPLTRAIGTAFAGSGGEVLNQSGYRHIVIRGRAETPVILRISNGSVDVEKAQELWGKDASQATAALYHQYGDSSTVIAIGPAGENQLAISFAWVNQMSHLGRGGLGAVMGAKRLKAIVLQGSRPVEVADSQGFSRIAGSLAKSLRSLSYWGDWVRAGSAIANWGKSSGWREKAADPFGPVEYMKMWRGAVACPSCPVACKFLVELPSQQGKSFLTKVSGISTAAKTWKKFQVSHLSQALILRDFCNRYGIDDVAMAALLDFAVTLFEEGIITRDDTGGLELRREYNTAVKLMQRIVHREGIGDILADGIEKAAQRIGRGAEKYVVTIKGQDPFFDPRLHFHGWHISEIVGMRGGAGIGGNSPAFMPGHPPETLARYLRRLRVPETDVDRICSPSNVNMGRLTKWTEDWYSVCSCLGICMRQPVVQCYSMEIAAQLLQAATGWETSPEELMRTGERAWNILKAANVRAGFSRKDDKFPEAFFHPLKEDGKSLVLKDYYGNLLDRAGVESLLDDYYQERGWEIERGIPTREKLVELNLSYVADDLEREGKL